MKRKMQFCSIAAALAFAAGCSGSPETPLSPSGAMGGNGLGANADGSTLKVSAPAPQSPGSDERVGTRPSFAFNGAISANGVANLPLSYRVQVLNEDGSVAGDSVGGGSPLELGGDLEAGKNYSWRVRAELQGASGPWSGRVPFSVAARASTGGGGFGPTRDISIGEALDIAIRVQREAGYNLGSGGSREERIAWLWASMAAVHFGHSRFNPQGGDPNWCVKDAGGGRPPSDDVMVRCDTRDAWDTVGGIGSNGYVFHMDYIGRLGFDQNVYPPPASALNGLPK